MPDTTRVWDLQTHFRKIIPDAVSLPLLANPSAPWDHPAISQSGHGSTGGYTLRTERYRYTIWADGAGGEEFYDYETDPREERNLADDSALAGLKAKLRARLEDIVRSRGKDSAPAARAPA